MNEIQYLGEHLWVGAIGHVCIILGFVTAILSTVSYFFAEKKRNDSSFDSWNRMGKYSFIIHSLCVFGLMVVLFIAMGFHYYEYRYVWEHVSDDLPMRYILSAFWEGQEGSFQLWMFWHAVLGLVLLSKKSRWEAPVIAIVVLMNAFIMSMLLGVHFEWGDSAIKLGINPTLLLRETMSIPLFNNADYVSLINGNGLNPLLQNYWMTIHPPTLFLGFASVTMPFAFAFAGLWTGEHRAWLKPALGWALFSAALLGIGILMGSFWAYEALSFGGYWAWDPVENASLVPWLTLVAGVHTHLIARSTKYSVKATYFFYIISLFFILYSTFLTRSGILGDTSAHAFTEMGLEWQLVIFMLFFLVLGLWMLVKKYKSIPAPKKEEGLFSREFWMFIGSLVLLFSSILIISSTSLPVYNAIVEYFDPGFEGKVIQDVIPHYNKYQLWIALFIGFLSGTTLFLRYNEKNWEARKSSFIKRIGLWLIASGVLTYLLSLWLNLYDWQFYLFSLAGWFAIVANLDYLISKLKGKLKLGASAIAHFGFGLMIIGLLGSGLNSSYISTNPFVFKDIFTREDAQKYVKLIKGKPMYAQGYWMTYKSDTLIERQRLYEVHFREVDENNETVDSFTTFPDAVYSNDFTKVASFNPDTRHYVHKDIFTCIVALSPEMSDIKLAKEIQDTLTYKTYMVAIGDTIDTGNNKLSIEGITFNPENEDYKDDKYDVGIGVLVNARRPEIDSTYKRVPALGIKGALSYNFPERIEDLNMRLRVKDTLIASLFSAEEELVYSPFTIKEGDSLKYNGIDFKLETFKKNPIHENYIAAEGDIAIGAHLIASKNGQEYNVDPIYIIRGNAPLSIKDYIPELGVHVRFSNINPAEETFSFNFASDLRDEVIIPLEIAENVPRSDYIILEAKAFPGINMFWLGTVLMMFGLILAWLVRYYQKRSA